jgi:5-methylcytosine-specific restriction endonuclease McrA
MHRSHNQRRDQRTAAGQAVRQVTVCLVCGSAIPETRSKKTKTCSPQCQKTARQAYGKEYFEVNRKAIRLKDTARRYGISLDALRDLIDESNGTCHICGQTDVGKELAVDHDHQTGAVRGLLCQRCNIMIGMALESTATLLAAIAYLERHYQVA